MKLKIDRALAQPLVQVVIVVLLGLAVYSNTFPVPFVFDDESSIVANPVVHQLQNFLSVDGPGYTQRPNRYIGYLSFALNYHFGGLEVTGYHVVNLLIHLANALLVYALLRLTLRAPFFEDGAPSPSREGSGLRAEGRFSPQARWGWGSSLPFLVALIFVAHPIQTQAVTYLVQRLTSLATLFYLAALVLHVRWRLAYHYGKAVASASVLPGLILSVVSAALAMKIKEISFSLPFVVLLYEVTFFGWPGRKLWGLLAPILSTVAIIPLTMLRAAAPAADLLSRMDAATMDNTPLTRPEYLYTQFSVIVTYLRLLVLPVNQNLDYDYPISHTLLEPRPLLSLLLLLALTAVAVFLFHRSARGRAETAGGGSPSGSLASRLSAFGIFWFFITLGVESSVVPIRDVIFEHRIYLPSVGFFLACTAPALSALTGIRIRGVATAAACAFALLVLVFGSATYARNDIWRDPVVLWQDVKQKSPMKTRPYNVLGTYYAEKGRVTEAIKEFEASLRLNPTAPDVLSILADSYREAGRLQEAEATYRMLAMVTAGANRPAK